MEAEKPEGFTQIGELPWESPEGHTAAADEEPYNRTQPELNFKSLLLQSPFCMAGVQKDVMMISVSLLLPFSSLFPRENKVVRAESRRGEKFHRCFQEANAGHAQFDCVLNGVNDGSSSSSMHRRGICPDGIF